MVGMVTAFLERWTAAMAVRKVLCSMSAVTSSNGRGVFIQAPTSLPVLSRRCLLNSEFPIGYVQPVVARLRLKTRAADTLFSKLSEMDPFRCMLENEHGIEFEGYVV